MKPAWISEGGGQHFIRHVTEAGESRQVSASEHIFSQNGIKLLAEGSAVNRGVFDRLVSHKLLKPLEESILVEGVLSAASIRNDINDLIDRSTDLQSLGNKGTTLYQIPGRIFIHPVIATKMTILKCRLPKLYASTCISSVVALQLGARLGLDDSELDMLVSAAIFHDIGELHIDPKILEQEGPLNSEQWRQIFTHPVTGYLMLSSLPDYRVGTDRLVLEHHERSDGSGYPSGLQADQLHALSPVMAVIDTFASQFDANGNCADPERLGVILRLTTHKFDWNAITKGLEMANLVAGERRNEEGDVPFEKFEDLLGSTVKFLEGWGKEIRPLIESRAESILQLLDRRIRILELHLNRAGLHPTNADSSQSVFAEDQTVQSEAAAILKEANWQRRGISTELHRAFPDLPDQIGQQPYQALMAWLEL
ncbi:MAG: HD domain-containing protein [Betaproteobacteria bacterium]|nr:HD domain-containing protein [Betaproteobacteria bacterium]MDE2622873.1 HD domain-containing protein [Betaproteobacteria bacterium]